MTKPTTATLLVLKTGLTTWDREGRIVGDTDLPLDAEERETLDARLSALTGEDPGVLFSAPDEASIETAERWGGMLGVKVRVIDALHEVELGLWEGALGEDLLARSPKLYKQWLADPSSVQAPEGEVFAEGERRVLGGLCKALEKLKSASPVVGIVSRRVASGMLRRALWEESNRDFWEIADAPWSRHEVSAEDFERFKRGAVALAGRGS